jgi:hypothetical protein
MMKSPLQVVLEQQGGPARRTFRSHTHRERGAARLAQLAPLMLAVGAAVYFAIAYFPAMTTYYQVSRQARELVQTSGADAGAVGTFVEHVRAQTGLSIDPSHIKLKRGAGRIQAMQLDLKLPLSFPFLNAGRALTFEVAAGRMTTVGE